MFSVGWMCGSVYFANHGQMNSGWGEGMVASGANIQRFCPVTARVGTKTSFPLLTKKNARHFRFV